MSRLVARPLRRVVHGISILALSALCVLAAGCGSKRPPAVYAKESFSATSAFSREFPSSVRTTCEAARRALLSQGYVLKDHKPDQISGTKRFQPKDATYTEIEFYVVCTPSSPNGQNTIAFANAIQGYYAMKKAPTTASLGLAALGSLSVPVGSSDEALVRIGGETIPSTEFYERFFSLTRHYLDSIPEY